MVKYCAVRGCKELQRKGSGIQFHRFPHSRPEVLKMWVNAARKEEWKPSKHSVICSKHFTEDNYKVRPEARVKMLKEDAVPSVFNICAHTHDMDTTKTELLSDEEEQLAHAGNEYQQSVETHEDPLRPIASSVQKDEFQSRNVSGVDSTSDGNEYQENSSGAKCDRCLRLQKLELQRLEPEASSPPQDIDTVKMETYTDEEGQLKSEANEHRPSDDATPFTFCVVKTEPEDLDIIKTEPETYEEGQSASTGDEYPQTDVKRVQETPCADEVVKTEVQSNVDEPELETEICSESPWSTSRIKLEVDPLEIKCENEALGLDNEIASSDDSNKSIAEHHNPKIHQSIHSIGMSYQCDICKKSFSKLSNLTPHMRTHTGERPYLCDVCQKSFAQLCNLQNHQRIHTGVRPYSCDVCNKSFSRIGHLKKHQRVHTGETPYTCNVCKKSFSQDSNLMEHQRIHTGERPFVCDVCQISFSRRGNLIKHQLVHTGERPFLCEVCNKPFARHSNLKQHQRTHTAQCSYFCDVCETSFVKLDSLKKHQRIHKSQQL